MRQLILTISLIISVTSFIQAQTLKINLRDNIPFNENLFVAKYIGEKLYYHDTIMVAKPIIKLDVKSYENGIYAFVFQKSVLMEFCYHGKSKEFDLSFGKLNRIEICKSCSECHCISESMKRKVVFHRK